MRLLATFLFVFFVTGQAIAAELEPFKATYAARFNGISITATRELSGQDGNWRLDFDSSALFASITEYSRFTSENGHISPRHYEYHRKGLGRNRTTVLNFEPAKGLVLNVHNPEQDLKDVPPNVLDKVSYQVQLALDIAAGKTDLQYQVADGKKIRNYKFNQIGTETLKTPLGPVETIKVARMRSKNSGKETTVWIAPQWNYTLVKLIQREENGKKYQINLTNLSINGKKVTPSQ
ncbi:DUF3108 domain-containing protein [Microbulbifer sp. SSSA002]|uniref:DUF3108 domain-containing protein n=1 Tax=unclassified Microbulbifer TaxID=2619833 RepID=UPI00403A2E89